MTGLPDYNHPAFHAAAERLRARGYEVVNPAEFAPRHDAMRWSDWMRLGLEALAQCDGVVALPGWQHSNGARLEVGVAARALEAPVHDEDYWHGPGLTLQPSYIR
jgi:hypothetical protein